MFTGSMVVSYFSFGAIGGYALIRERAHHERVHALGHPSISIVAKVNDKAEAEKYFVEPVKSAS